MATVAWAVAMAVFMVATVTAAATHCTVEDTGPMASTEMFSLLATSFCFAGTTSRFPYMRNF